LMKLPISAIAKVREAPARKCDRRKAIVL